MAKRPFKVWSHLSLEGAFGVGIALGGSVICFIEPVRTVGASAVFVVAATALVEFLIRRVQR